MRIDSTSAHACWRGLRRGAVGALTLCMAFAAAGAIDMDPPASPSQLLQLAPSAPPQDTEHLLVLVCRPASVPAALQMHPQEMPQDLPLMCLVTMAHEQALRMGPARFQQLLDEALNAGVGVVLVRPPR